MKKTKTIKVGQIVVITDHRTGFKQNTICKLVHKEDYSSTQENKWDVICTTPTKIKGLDHNNAIEIYIQPNFKGYGYFQYMSQLRPATEEEKKLYRKGIYKTTK